MCLQDIGYLKDTGCDMLWHAVNPSRRLDAPTHPNPAWLRLSDAGEQNGRLWRSSQLGQLKYL